MIYKCIIIDDERHFTELLAEYIAMVPQLELIKIFHSPVKALAEISKENQIDIIFLDINMPKITGFELAPFLKTQSRFLVFTTAHTKHAVKAFDIEVDDFLHKPVSFERFQKTVDKIIRKSEYILSPKSEPDNYFYAKLPGYQSKWSTFAYDDVIAFESDKNYVKIFTSNKCQRIYMGIKGVENILAGRNDFIRIHRSFIISKKFIDQVDNNIVIMKQSNIKITIGKHYRKIFFDYIESKIFK